jgi:hypothetical protein
MSHEADTRAKAAGLVPDGRGGYEPSRELWAALREAYYGHKSSYHTHDCACSGWSHDDPTCEYTHWYPCPDCDARVDSGEEA